MTILTLKSCQQAARDALRAFARAAQLKCPALAFGEQEGRPYNPDPFGETTCICLRIPTGGGKTMMPAHAVNVLAESMIKLPIALSEHPEGWQQVVFAAVQNQRALEGEALKDEANSHGYMRPIVLFEAHNASDEVPPEALRKHLEIVELWARGSNKHCLFGQIAKEPVGVGMSGPLDTLLA